jgi:hypothetical protein
VARRASSASSAAAAAALLTLAVVLPGCAQVGRSSRATTAASSAQTTTPIVHVVVDQTGARVADHRADIWFDPATSTRRSSFTSGQTGGHEELIRDGVWTDLQGDPTMKPTPSGMVGTQRNGGRMWMNALVMDAPPGVVRTDPSYLLLDPIDLGYFRRAVDAGQAHLVATSTVAGVPVEQVRLELRKKPTLVPYAVVTADVRRSDYAPVKVVYMMASGRAVKVAYSTAEWVPRALGLWHLALAIPPGVPVIERRTLSVPAAAAYPVVKVRWLGRVFEGMRFAADGSSDAPGGPGFWLSRYVGPPDPLLLFGSFPSAAQQLLMAGPDLGRTSVQATYGDMAGSQTRHGGRTRPFLLVMSYPATDTAAWRSRYVSDVTTSMIAGRTAVSYSRTLGMKLGTARYVIVGTGDATVMVAGLSVADGVVERAAAALVPVKGAAR